MFVLHLHIKVTGGGNEVNPPGVVGPGEKPGGHGKPSKKPNKKHKRKKHRRRRPHKKPVKPNVNGPNGLVPGGGTETEGGGVVGGEQEGGEVEGGDVGDGGVVGGESGSSVKPGQGESQTGEQGGNPEEGGVETDQNQGSKPGDKEEAGTGNGSGNGKPNKKPGGGHKPGPNKKPRPTKPKPNKHGTTKAPLKPPDLLSIYKKIKEILTKRKNEHIEKFNKALNEYNKISNKVTGELDKDKPKIKKVIECSQELTEKSQKMLYTIYQTKAGLHELKSKLTMIIISINNENNIVRSEIEVIEQMFPALYFTQNLYSLNYPLSNLMRFKHSCYFSCAKQKMVYLDENLKMKKQ